MRTLGAGHEKAGHAETSDQSLSQPDQAIVALTIAATADRNAEHELSEDHEYGTDDNKGPVVARVEEATNDGGQQQDDE